MEVLSEINPSLHKLLLIMLIYHSNRNPKTPYWKGHFVLSMVVSQIYFSTVLFLLPVYPPTIKKILQKKETKEKISLP